ncbi:hypothetical protein ESP131_10780 [Exiguobacterium sp. U13-1]|uniref:Lipoprotein n=1 Tax=Exiguobacterium acetylicum TaxID=41170 RepID=A0ABX8G654_EXIAC|nr:MULTISPECIES: hypothetical protein [Exiguobacterium]AOT00716.1 hypothetical protein ESP131_10780 [Exiguobacterium sp. U13-1]QWB28662.1 hypothetical protein KKI46_08585 [Exiguobacterium acetylicum]HBQ75599.1 hypothetical protein [Exiguobacterium sp.]HCD60360.1 hypothetical protein [Exiguobacterium sp.]
MNKRFWIGLTLGATLALSGCQSDAPNFKWDYLSQMYDGGQFNEKESRTLSAKERTAIQKTCASKVSDAPTDYAVGDIYSVMMTNPFEDYEGQTVRYVKAGKKRYLYCQTSFKGGYYPLPKKDDVFKKTALTQQRKNFNVKPTVLKKDDWFNPDEKIADHSARTLELPGSGYLVIEATDVTKKDTRTTSFVYTNSLTPFTRDVDLYLVYNQQFGSTYDVSVRIPQLYGGRRAEHPIHSMKHPGKVRFIPGDGTPEHYGTVIATEKNGREFRYELSIRHTTEQPTELQEPNQTTDDLVVDNEEMTLIHQRQFSHVRFEEDDQGNRISEKGLDWDHMIMMTSDESGKLKKAIKTSEQADVRGKRAKWKYLTFRDGVKGQQYEVYLDKRVKKTDVYLKDPKRDVSIHLSATGRDILLPLFEQYEK